MAKLTLAEMDRIVFNRDGSIAPGILLVGKPYSYIKAAFRGYEIELLPSYWENAFLLKFWVNTERANPYYGLNWKYSVWEYYMYDNVVPSSNQFEYRLTGKDRVLVAKLIPKNNNYVTLSFEVNNDGRQLEITIKNDGTVTEIEARIVGCQVFYLKADKVAKGASITADSTYADSWASGGNQKRTADRRKDT